MARNGINQKSIAKNLNLSVATISKALGDSTEINSRTRARVINMASKMGYKCPGARGKKSAEANSKFVGVLIHSHPDEWQRATYFAGMSEKCAKLNVSLTLHYFTTADREHVLDPEYQPPVMRDKQLSGVILVNRWPGQIVKKLLKDFPCVSVIHEVPGVDLDVIGVDDTSGISKLTDHLYELGHRKIGFFGRCGEMTWSRARFGAYAESLCRLGLEYAPESVSDVSIEQLENRSMALDEQIDYVAGRIKCGVRAWMCASDWVGYVLCRGLMDRGFNVPRDVSITGFDNTEINQLGCPELTSTIVPVVKIGAEALRRLMARLRHPTSPQLHIKLPCEFAPGETTAPPSQG